MKTKPSRSLITAALAAALTTAISNTALAVDWTGTAGDDWHDTANWGGNPVPGVGGTVGQDVKFPIGSDTIDVNGTAVSVGEIYISGNSQTILDTGDSITATSLRFHSGSSEIISADLVISGQIYTTRKSVNQTYNGSVTFGGIDMGQGQSTFNGPVTVTGANGLEAFYKSINQGTTGPIYVFNDTLTSANGGSITSNLGTRVTTVKAGAGNTLSGLGDTLNVDAAGILDLAVAQTGAPPYGTGSISVNAYGLLVGDTGTSTWGPGNHIDVKTDGILATTAGSTPTTGDIGVAVAWQGVTSSGTWTAGNDGSSVFKGLAVGGFNDNLSSTTLQSPAGAGDVAILVLPGLGTSGQSADIVSLDGTGIANFHCVGLFRSNGGRLNPNDLANAVTTYNFFGESASTEQMVDLYNNFTVESGETYNFSGSGWVEVDPDNVEGALSFDEETQLAAGATAFPDVGTNPDTMLTFNDGASLALGSNEVALLEDLTPAQIATSGTVTLTLETGGSNNPATITPQFDINAADTPNLIEFMKKSNINVQGGNNNYADLLGEGLIVADGKYLMCYSDSHKGLHLRAAAYDAGTNPYGPAKISGVSGAATMGIANFHNAYLDVIIPIDANGAKLVLNNDQVMTAVKSGNARFTEAPDNDVRLAGPITDTPEIDVRNGRIDFDPGVSVPAGVTLTIQSGATAQLDAAVTVGTIAGNGNVNNAVNLAFSTVAPGTSVGALNLNTFTMTNGATYNCEISGNGGAPGGSPAAGADNDVIDGGTVTFDIAWKLNLVNTGLNAGDLNGTEVFTIIDAGSISGFVAPTIMATGFDTSSAVVSQNGGNVEVTGLLVDAGGGDFPDWIAGYPGVGAEDGLDDDPDGDNNDNGVENFFGTAPDVGTAGLSAGAVTTGGSNTFTFTHPQGTLADDLTATYRWSTDLATFTGDGVANGGTTVSFSATPDTPVAGTTTVTATITGTIPDKLFVDVEVTQTP